MTETPASTFQGLSARSQAKADRRQSLMDAAARLFAESGFNGVSIEELGAAAGVSGPAVYKHFVGKQAVLAALLLDASEGLLSGGQRVVERYSAKRALIALVEFHVDFALKNSDVIRVQDRDLDSLRETDRHRVRALQRQYVELWVATLGDVYPSAAPAILRTKAHATFGLLNSTPHSGLSLPRSQLKTELQSMALAALRARSV